jgi:hypothetical protein
VLRFSIASSVAKELCGGDRLWWQTACSSLVRIAARCVVSSSVSANVLSYAQTTCREFFMPQRIIIKNLESLVLSTLTVMSIVRQLQCTDRENVSKQGLATPP